MSSFVISGNRGHKSKVLSPVRIIVFSFLFIILIGTLLLSLPVASNDGRPTTLVDSLFVATSATCVTGLTVFDTFTKWSFFGQLVIFLLIQFGGLGLVSFTTGFMLVFRRKLGLRDIQLAKEYTSGSIVDTPKLILTVLVWSVACEAIGATLFAIRFVPKYGLRGVWVSVFTAVSAYCNAGFDIMGFTKPGIGLIEYSGDALVSLTIAFLIIVGGIGFAVVSDIHSIIVKRLHDRKSHPHINVHSRIVIKTTIILLVLGTVLFLIFEYNNTLKDLDLPGKIIASFFQSSSARTAGFYSVPLDQEADITKMVTVLLMFIGASPSSTGGGVKTTTFIVILYTVISVFKGGNDTEIMNHRVEKQVVYRALAIVIMAIFIVSALTIAISVLESYQGIHMIDILFESVSAFATVGLSTGITHLFCVTSKLLIAITMFIGRVGPISLVLALTLRSTSGADRILPPSRIIVG